MYADKFHNKSDNPNNGIKNIKNLYVTFLLKYNNPYINQIKIASECPLRNGNPIYDI